MTYGAKSHRPTPSWASSDRPRPPPDSGIRNTTGAGSRSRINTWKYNHRTVRDNPPASKLRACHCEWNYGIGPWFALKLRECHCTLQAREQKWYGCWRLLSQVLQTLGEPLKARDWGLWFMNTTLALLVIYGWKKKRFFSSIEWNLWQKMQNLEMGCVRVLEN